MKTYMVKFATVSFTFRKKQTKKKAPQTLHEKCEWVFVVCRASLATWFFWPYLTVWTTLSW